jgi:DNA helicase II / ATP-dependent DNA helicase PcrA
MNGGAEYNAPWTAGGLPRGGGTPDAARFLEGLTAPQRQAVEHAGGPLLVLAAAGSGKTRVITRRIAFLIAGGVRPWQILALTFTNKAAGEMRERVGSLLGSEGPRGLTVTTFHSLCARLLRRYAEPAGLKPEFTIYDADDQSRLCKKVIENLQLSTSNFPPRSVLSAISRAKNDLLDADAFAARAMDFSSRTIARIYQAYSRALAAAGAVDFDDLLLRTATLLRKDAGVRDELRARWRHVLVDEYQDTNRAQFLIASLIAGEPDTAGGEGAGPNFCVVGDPDQAIYGWRGADISNILDFEEHYPGCRVITLGENFRSTAPILAAADALIRRNRRRKHKDLFTSRQGGDRPEAVLCRDERHEAALVCDWFRARREAGAAWRDMAVFYRTNALSRVMEDALRGAGVPYTIARGTAFFEREEVRHALGYLRVVANPADGVSLERVINVPARGIGKTTVDALSAEAQDAGEPLMEACRRAGEIAGLTARAAASVKRLVDLVDAWTGSGSFMGERVSGTLWELVSRVIEESGLRGMYKAQAAASGSDADAQRVDNLDELVSSARQFEMEYDPAADAGSEAPAGGEDPLALPTPPLLAMLRAYLESVALVADADAVDPESGSVTLMTLHAAKGLEFDSVAMIGMEEGQLPHSRAIMSVTGGDAEMEEERRLAFVGITRAMRRLLMTAARYRTVRGIPERTIPSRFLGEIPESCLRVSDQSSDLEPGWDVAAGDDEAPRAAGRSTGSLPAGSASAGAGRGQAFGSGDGGGGAVPSKGPAAAFPVGTRVRHPQFGMGVVKAVQGGSSARATIDFAGVGVKTLVLEYARLTRV